MNASDYNLPSTSLRTPISVNYARSKVHRQPLSSRPCDSISIPSVLSFLSAKSDRTASIVGLSPCRSSPILATQRRTSLSDTERDTRTMDSGLAGTCGDDGELCEIDEENYFFSDASDLFSSSPNLIPNHSSNEDSTEAGCDFHSIRTSETPLSTLNNTSVKGQSRNIYSPKKSKSTKKRLSYWYQVKRETFAKSYQAKVNHFKKVFDGTSVDTDRLLVDYSCALAKNKNGLLLGRMYITEKWICFYSKIISELKLQVAVDNVQTVSKAKTARFIPNAIQITLKSNNERYFFTSFASRERTFAILKKVCEKGKNGGGLLQSENGAASLEDLLCQVQDVYGDESLGVLDFEDGDLDDDVPPSNRESCAISSELCNASISPSLRSPYLKRASIEAPLLRPQRYSTDGLRARGPQRRSSTHGGPNKRSFSSYDLSESDTSVTTGTSDDDVAEDGSRGGIEINFASGLRECNASHQPSNRVSTTSIEIEHQNDNEQLHNKAEHVKEEESQLITCGTGHDHSGRIYAAVDINVSVDALFAILFTDSQFFASFCTHRSTFDVEQSRWPRKPWPAPSTGDATLHRKISYVLTLKQRLGPRTCRAFESQTILLRETRPGIRYVVDATVTNEAVPLCNSFHVTTRYCLLRRGVAVSHLIITSEVVYDRPVFFGAKSIIESTCRSNLTDNFNDLVNHLVSAVARLSNQECITGGVLSRHYRPRVTHSHLETDGCSSVGADGIAISKNSVSPAGSGTNVQQTPRGLSIPQVLLYPGQQSDRIWLFVIAASLGLCVFLSMVYNRYQRVERIISDYFEFTTQPTGSDSVCCDELTSVRLLIESVSGVLVQMRTTLDLLERRLDQLGSESCRFKNAFLGR